MASKKKDSESEHHSRTVSLTVGTAGHIDHGKTRLIYLLTGCETDRLPEERARGMTIDLGFASCRLPNDERIGIVDVPGHERFIHNMVAGASGVDVVLLVVAADDGVMPQTIEHFHIVRLLGVTSGMVAVTKTDLVEPARIAEVERQVEDLVKGSFLEGCPVVPVSSKTGDGLSEFYDAFVGVVDRTVQGEGRGPFRVHVARSFVLKGLGTIVSGIPCSGTVRVGDNLELLPSGGKKRVRGIQVYGAESTEGRGGECVALRLSNVSVDEVHRGVVLASPGYFVPSRFIAVRFHFLSSAARPLKGRTAVRFHVGTSHVPGHLVLPQDGPLKPGAETYCQVQLKRPVVTAPGDFYVMRLLSPVATIGGGYVVACEETKMRRSKGESWSEECRRCEEAFRRPETALCYALQRAAPRALGAAELSRRAFLDLASMLEHTARLVEAGDIAELPGERYAHRSSVEKSRREVTAALASLHDEQPLSRGFTKKELFRRVEKNLLVEEALATLVASGDVVDGSAGLLLPERAPRLSPAQQAIAERICRVYMDAGFSTPRRDELPGIVGEEQEILDPIVEYLGQSGRLVMVSDRVIIHSEHIAAAREMLLAQLEEHGSIESGEFRDMLGTTRKYSIAILEYWDKQGLTRRTGNRRVLRE